MDVAERAGIGRLAYIGLENGNPGTSLAVFMRVMAVFGYDTPLQTLLQPDPIGDDFAAFHGRKRAGGRRDLADF